MWVSQRKAGHYVIGADQTLALGDRLFNKPGGRAAAAEQIRALSGQTHALHSAIAVALDGTDRVRDGRGRQDDDAIPERGRYRRLSGRSRRGRDRQSVGAYQLEGLGVHLFERIEGDHSTILGLPLLPLLGFLRSQHLLAL